MTIDECNFTSNVASGSGGAIYLNDALINLTNSNFSYNQAGDSDNGGAVYSTLPTTSTASSLRILSDITRVSNVTNCTIVYNSAGIGGGIR